MTISLVPIPVTIGSISLPDGDLWIALYRWILHLFPLATATAILIGLAIIYAPKMPARAKAWIAGRATSWREGLGFLLLSGVVLLLTDGSQFVHGFFRQDDFSFLAVAGGDIPLREQWTMYHNDHLYPLFRLQVHTLLSLAGPHADELTLAAWFNAVSFLTHFATAAAGLWLLQEIGARRATLLGFLVLIWIWPGWGEFTSGYYTIGVYIQILALGLAGAAATIRYLQTRAYRWMIIAFAMAVTAIGLNTSGIWTIVAQGALAVTYGLPRDHRAAWRHLGATLLIFGAATLTLLVLLRHQPSTRELVQNPGGSSVAEKLHDISPSDALSAMLNLPAVPGGIALSMVVPPYLHLGDAKVAKRPFAVFAFWLLQLMPGIFLGAWWWRRGLHRTLAESSSAIALLLMVTVLAVLVLTARARYAAVTPVALWEPKYQAPLWVGTVLWMLFCLERILCTYAKPAEHLTRLLILIAVSCGPVYLFHQRFDQSITPVPVRYLEQGRWANLQAAKLRRTEYRDVMAKLDAAPTHLAPNTVQLPPWQTWFELFAQRYPMLEWSGDQGRFGVTYLLSDLPFARPRSRLRIEWIALTRPNENLRSHTGAFWFDSTASSATN